MANTVEIIETTEKATEVAKTIMGLTKDEFRTAVKMGVVMGFTEKAFTEVVIPGTKKVIGKVTGIFTKKKPVEVRAEEIVEVEIEE